MKDKIKHLEFIQNIITRMATNSFILKGWAVTVISILFVLELNHLNNNLFVFTLFPAFIFWGLDSYYLRQEKLFRRLYDHSRKNIGQDDMFSLSTKRIEGEVDSWFRILFNPTIYYLYGTIVVMILIILIILKQGGT